MLPKGVTTVGIKKCSLSNIIVARMWFDVTTEIVVCVLYTFDFLQALQITLVASKNDGDSMCIDTVSIEKFLQFGGNILSFPEDKDEKMQYHLDQAVTKRRNVCIKSSMVLLLYVRRLYGKDITQLLSKWFYVSSYSWEWTLITDF